MAGHVAGTRRTAAWMSLVGLVTLLVGPLPSARAEPGDVDDAQVQLAAMRGKVSGVAASLQSATRKYEEGQRSLLRVQRTERSAQRRLRELSAASVDEQRRLDQFAAATYRRPFPGLAVLALAGRPGEFTSSLVAKADIEHVAGTQQDALSTVRVARIRAAQLTRVANQLSAEARAVERRLSRQLAALRETATRANEERLPVEIVRLTSERNAADQAASRAGEPSVVHASHRDSHLHGGMHAVIQNEINGASEHDGEPVPGRPTRLRGRR